MPTPRKHKDAAACQAAYRKRQAEARRLEMKRKGLPDLPPISSMPGERRWWVMLSEATALVQMVVDERETYKDDRSEEWQESDRGEEFQERTTTVQEALEALEAIDGS
jgi:hypothetical protein